MTTRRIGLIGAGHISWYHLQAWAKVADAQVVAVCDIDPTRAASRASEFGIDGVYGDAAEMLAAVPLDAVDIATWRATHADLILMRRSAPPHVKLKAAGGVRDLDAAIAVAELGCDRIGASKTAEILWKFTKAGTFEFSCLIPGHRDYGMVGHVTVN